MARLCHEKTDQCELATVLKTGSTNHGSVKYTSFVRLSSAHVLAVPEVLGVEKDVGDGDVVAKHSDHVLRQRQHLRQPTVVDAVRRTTQRAPETKLSWTKFLQDC